VLLHPGRVSEMKWTSLLNSTGDGFDGVPNSERSVQVKNDGLARYIPCFCVR